jgi:pyruvate dehydrogenase E2 component (dihydrolipoamide acetyltransferase)
MESGTVVKWLKAEGDAVEKGEPLYELDTDKVTQEVEAEASGVLLKIVVPEGEVPVATTLAFIGEPGEQVEAPKDEAPAPEPQAPSPAPAPDVPQVAVVAAPAPERSAGERIKASPLARRLAREQGVDLAAITGTGPEGRIVAEDVERATAAAPPAPEPSPAPAEPAAPAERPSAAIGDDVKRVPLTSIRRTIARRLTEAWQIPVFQLVLSADMDAVDQVLARRKELNPDEHVTVTDVLVKVCAAALMRHREVNVQFTEEELLVFPYANIGIAVATDRGLMVPVIRNAEHLSLAEVSAARADVVKRAREGALRHEDLDAGTFTISNLGMFGLDQFTAVLNPPQAAILAVGASAERAVVREGQIIARPMMTMTLSCDHRAVDGAPAAAFLETLKAMLEDLSLAL